MKLLLAALLAFTVFGCASPKTVAYQENAMDRCSMAAEQRMQDGAANGYNEGMQKRVYIGALADCKKEQASYTMLIDLPIPGRSKP
jgi:hypothetical protein